MKPSFKNLIERQAMEKLLKVSPTKLVAHLAMKMRIPLAEMAKIVSTDVETLKTNLEKYELSKQNVSRGEQVLPGAPSDGKEAGD
jgi:hypothetical protein